MKEVKITPAVKKRAEKFQTLHQKGYSVKEAAEEMKVSIETIYIELQAYAEINGKPTFDKPDRLYYIREYKSRQQGVKITRSKISTSETQSDKSTSTVPKSDKSTSTVPKVEKNSNAEAVNQSTEASFTDSSQTQNAIDNELKLLSECFETVENYSEYLLGVLSQIASTHTETIANFKEEAK